MTQIPAKDVTFMNYGYALTEGDKIYLKENKDDPWVYSMQLYNHAVVRFASINNLNVKRIAEVGSGRGGGISHITKILKPMEAIGIDLCPENI